jgi:hypothetical protein
MSLIGRGWNQTVQEFIYDLELSDLYIMAGGVATTLLLIIYWLLRPILEPKRYVTGFWKRVIPFASILIILSLFSGNGMVSFVENRIIPTPTPTTTLIPTVRSSMTPSPTFTMTPIPPHTPTLTEVPTQVGSPTPWLDDGFSSARLDLRMWDGFTCNPPYANYVVGAPVFRLDGEDVSECWLVALLDEDRVDKIGATIELVSGFADAGYASIRTSCGDKYLYYQFDARVIGYLIEGKEWQLIKPHGISLPVKLTLVIHWLKNNNISLSAYETEDMELIKSIEIECSSHPEYVHFGARTSPGYPIIINIDSIEISGPGIK